MADGYDFVASDTNSVRRVTCRNRNGSAINLTGATVAMRWRDATGQLVMRNMTIVGAATDGVAEYKFAAGELFDPKMHLGYKITDATGKVVSSNKLDTISVRKPLA